MYICLWDVAAVLFASVFSLLAFNQPEMIPVGASPLAEMPVGSFD